MAFNKALLRKEVQDFIKNFEDDTTKLAFSGSPFQDISVQELLQQIESRNKVEKKLPTWFKTENILYPPKLNLEQTSSEETAKYKASLIKGKKLADITGGFGVDAFHFSETFEEVDHFETNAQLSQLAKHNFEIFGKKNINCIAESGIEKITENKYDVIYADPSRRNETKGKVNSLIDSEPNVLENVDAILENCKTFLLKTSPMLDITQGLRELKNVTEIHCVAVKNEMKELLWVVQKEAEIVPKIFCVNITSEGNETFEFFYGEEAEIVYGSPQRFLYEPNVSVLKSGGFNLLSEAFKLKKLHKNTHLFTGEMLRDFPGRRFYIKAVIPYSKKEMKNVIASKKMNVATRNFPESVSTLKKKWKIEDGGEQYVFFTTQNDESKVVLLCEKV